MFCVVCDYFNCNAKGKQYKQKTSQKFYQNVIRSLAKPGLA